VSPRVRRLVTVNAGSTSLKVTLFDGEAVVSRSGDLDEVLRGWPGTDGQPPDAVVHRVVHGGDRTRAAMLDDAVVAELDALTELAPLHQPPALAAVRRTRSTWPDVPQVACFDTAFHATIPAAATYALPERLRALVRVYGFHGLSHAWASGVVRRRVPGARRVLVAHLGGGSSLCAVLDGASVDTTMGFTPLAGLVMATRSGSLDPGAVVWLAAHTGEDLARVLEQESGLLGLCGTSDMREVLARRAAGDPAAGLAFDVFVHRLVSSVGSMVAALGGLEVLVFTGGVGEHAAAVRAAVADRLGWLGVELAGSGEAPAEDGNGNGRSTGAGGETDAGPDAGADAREISAPGAGVRTFVVAAREDCRLAVEARALLGAQPG